MAAEDLVSGDRPAAHRLAPVVDVRRQVELLDHEIDHAVEDVVLVRDVVVERHRFHAEPRRHLAHGDRADPALVGDLHRRGEDPISIQGKARPGLFGASASLLGHSLPRGLTYLLSKCILPVLT